ncbi:MAG: hypothetical protein F6K37_38125 [Moorea sp. SIO4E2]|nr:hypothetical protein [Moorena sp. SIO4E2]
MLACLGCISFLLFDTVVRYGASYPNPGYEAENEAPLTHPTQLFYKYEMHPMPIASCLLPITYYLLPIASCLLPLASCLLPITCSLLPAP